MQVITIREKAKSLRDKIKGCGLSKWWMLRPDHPFTPGCDLHDDQDMKPGGATAEDDQQLFEYFEKVADTPWLKLQRLIYQPVVTGRRLLRSTMLRAGLWRE